MRSLPAKYLPISIFLILVFCGGAAKTVVAQNAINGMVLDENRRAVSEIDVELLDEFGRYIKSTKTKGGGIFYFQNLGAGIYHIQVRVGGTGYKNEKERIELGVTNRTIQTSTGTRTVGADIRQLTIRLRIDKRKREGVPVTNQVVFVQNIPEEAKKSYESALKKLDKKKIGAAVEDLEKAVDVFPDYYDALERLGNVYIGQKKYAEAEIALKRAVSINSKDFSSFFSLAVAQNNLKKKSDAVDGLLKAIELNSNSINSLLLLGIIQRDLRQFKEAEATLLKARNVAKKPVGDVHWNLALLYYYDLKLYDKAADELELYLRTLKSRDPEIKQKRAYVKKLIKSLREKARLITE